MSACVLARVDAAGVKRMISIRGDNRALRPDAKELRHYTEREATYYGNVFVQNQPRLPLPVAGQDQRRARVRRFARRLPDDGRGLV